MSDITILHNPRCSKSRQTLELLRTKGIEPTVVEYLKQPLSTEELSALFNKLGLTAVTDMMRTKEPEFAQAGLKGTEVSLEQGIAAMVEFPKLLERPVVINGNQAKIGRPPEAVLDII